METVELSRVLVMFDGMSCLPSQITPYKLHTLYASDWSFVISCLPYFDLWRWGVWETQPRVQHSTYVRVKENHRVMLNFPITICKFFLWTWCNISWPPWDEVWNWNNWSLTTKCKRTFTQDGSPKIRVNIK